MRSVASSRARHSPADPRGLLEFKRDVETRIANGDARWPGAGITRRAQTSSRRSETTTWTNVCRSPGRYSGFDLLFSIFYFRFHNPGGPILFELVSTPARHEQFHYAQDIRLR